VARTATARRQRRAPVVAGIVGATDCGPPNVLSVEQFRALGEPSKATQYVIGFLLERPSERVLLVRKNKPTWQRGLLNGIGGKIEPNETPMAAMHREWAEEVGDGKMLPWRYFAQMTSSRSLIDCYAAECNHLPRDSGFNDVGEEFATVHLSEIGLRRDCIRNLKWLLPLAFDDPHHQFIVAEFDNDD